MVDVDDVVGLAGHSVQVAFQQIPGGGLGRRGGSVLEFAPVGLQLVVDLVQEGVFVVVVLGQTLSLVVLREEYRLLGLAHRHALFCLGVFFFEVVQEVLQVVGFGVALLGHLADEHRGDAFGLELVLAPHPLVLQLLRVTQGTRTLLF